jgi:hypothetical protein
VERNRPHDEVALQAVDFTFFIADHEQAGVADLDDLDRAVHGPLQICERVGDPCDVPGFLIRALDDDFNLLNQ